MKLKENLHGSTPHENKFNIYPWEESLSGFCRNKVVFPLNLTLAIEYRGTNGGFVLLDLGIDELGHNRSK